MNKHFLWTNYSKV